MLTASDPHCEDGARWRGSRRPQSQRPRRQPKPTSGQGDNSPAGRAEGGRVMAEDVAPLVEALLAIIDAARPICRRTGSRELRQPGQSYSDVNLSRHVSERTYLFLAGQRTFDGIDATLPWYDARKACGVTLPQSVAPPGSPRCPPPPHGGGRAPCGRTASRPAGLTGQPSRLPPAWRWPAPFGGRLSLRISRPHSHV